MGARSDDAGDAFERVAVRRVAGCAPGASREEANSFEGNTVSNADQTTSDVGHSMGLRACHRSDSHEHSFRGAFRPSAFFRGLAFASRHTPCAGRGASGIVIDNCLDGAHVTAHRSRSREGAMAARVDGEDAVGRAVASDLMERRRPSGDASRPSEDPTSPRAWFETALRSIRDGRCHAYCAAPGMPSAVLWSAWEALGPPPPPDHLAVPDVESADPNDSAGEQWRAHDASGVVQRHLALSL